MFEDPEGSRQNFSGPVEGAGTMADTEELEGKETTRSSFMFRWEAQRQQRFYSLNFL